MITADLKNKETSLTTLTDQNGKSITVCSSKEESELLSPSQLVQGGLVGCMAMTIRRALVDNGIDFTDLKVSVDLKEEEDAYKFIYSVEIETTADPALVQSIKEKAIAQCYVHNIFLKGIKVVSGEAEASECDCCCG